MDPAILDYLMLAAGTMTATTLGFAAAWLRARERAIRAESRLAAQPSALSDARFDRIDQSIESMALELERIAEAERFQTQLLSNRGSAEARLISPQ